MLKHSLKHWSRLWISSLIVAWFFDFLFWKKTPGISFTVYVVLCLAAGFALARGEGLRPARTSLLLLLPIIFFAALSFIRLEPLTFGLNYLATLALMALLTLTFLGGRWVVYGCRDYAIGAVQIVFSGFIRPVLAYAEKLRAKATVPASESGKSLPFWRRSLPVLRGLVLAVPIVAIFAVLLASADAVFSKQLENILSSFRLEKLPEYIFRLTYILMGAYLLTGIYLHALTASHDEHLTAGKDKPWPAPFIGFTESAVVLGSVDLLFAFFVSIQFRYFFGGNANIHLEGYTYAEYARRGFDELVVVAFFSLLLFLGLSTVVRRQTAYQRRAFSGLGVILTLLVIVILASAFQRLSLYEDAYGFTRLRTYPHVFMVWLGVLLVVLLGLELIGRLRYFTLACLLAMVGFVVTLNLVNVDALIVHQNVRRAQAGLPLDVDYLNSLSADAVPALMDWYTSKNLSDDLKAEIGGILACRSAQLSFEKKEMPWQAFHVSQWRAQTLLQDHQSELNVYPVIQDSYGRWAVNVNGQQRVCFAGRP
jgi:hypothetical protein